jgi:hypothetical protein
VQRDTVLDQNIDKWTEREDSSSGRRMKTKDLLTQETAHASVLHDHLLVPHSQKRTYSYDNNLYGNWNETEDKERD